VILDGIRDKKNHTYANFPKNDGSTAGDVGTLQTDLKNLKKYLLLKFIAREPS
jgi:hypothetical protein